MFFTIIPSGSINVFMKLSVLNQCNLKFSYVVGIAEIVLYYVSIIVGMYAMYKMRRHYGQEEPYLARKKEQTPPQTLESESESE